MGSTRIEAAGLASHCSQHWSVGIAGDHQAPVGQIRGEQRGCGGNLAVPESVEMIVDHPHHRPIPGTIFNEPRRLIGDHVAHALGGPAVALAVDDHHRDAAPGPFHHLHRVAAHPHSVFHYLGNIHLYFHTYRLIPLKAFTALIQYSRISSLNSAESR